MAASSATVDLSFEFRLNILTQLVEALDMANRDLIAKLGATFMNSLTTEERNEMQRIHADVFLVTVPFAEGKALALESAAAGKRIGNDGSFLRGIIERLDDELLAATLDYAGDLDKESKDVVQEYKRRAEKEGSVKTFLLNKIFPEKQVFAPEDIEHIRVRIRKPYSELRQQFGKMTTPMSSDSGACCFLSGVAVGIGTVGLAASVLEGSVPGALGSAAVVLAGAHAAHQCC
jgi:hypothetical protein